MNTSTYPKLNDEGWLRELYIERRMDIGAIAKQLGCERGAVKRALQRFDIPTRSRGKAVTHSQLTDREWLEEALRHMNLSQIARQVGATTPTVSRWAKQHGLQIGGRSERVKAGLKKRYPEGRLGSSSSNWRGGRTKRGSYWWLHRDVVAERWPDHPRLEKPRWRIFQEHILVWEAANGRCVEPGEVIHHDNHNKEDNRPENLVFRESMSDHHAQHWAERDEIVYLKAEAQRLRAILDAYGISYEEEG